MVLIITLLLVRRLIRQTRRYEIFENESTVHANMCHLDIEVSRDQL